jgi:hypothetical protein
MKIRFKDKPVRDEFGNVFEDLEYLVLGMEVNHYYFIDQNNQVAMLAKDLFKITDDVAPDFWVEDNGRLVPEDWLWDNFLSLNDEPYQESEEIWHTTQFAKGLEKFNFSSIPSNFAKAYDTTYKVNLIDNYLTVASDYDSLIDVRHKYSFTSFKKLGDLPYFRIINGNPQYYDKVLITNDTITGFEIISEALKEIGSSFGYSNYNFDSYWIETIRKRILLSIWSIWGTKNFDVYKISYVRGGSQDYLLEKNNDVYKLSFHYFT